jgi:hypothetical protein
MTWQSSYVDSLSLTLIRLVSCEAKIYDEAPSTEPESDSPSTASVAASRTKLPHKRQDGMRIEHLKWANRMDLTV